MRVLVLGATGFAGYPAAQALVRAGHTVFGLIRNSDRAHELESNEIIPIVGSPEAPDSWSDIVRDLDVVIDAYGGMDVAKLNQLTLAAIRNAAKKYRPAEADRLGYVYVSGGMTWGAEDSYRTDTTPVHVKGKAVEWRLGHEQEILRDPLFNGVVIRSSLIYGYSGSILAKFVFEPASKGEKVRWPGAPGKLISTIHADDLAELITLAAEKSSLVGGKTFLGVNNSMESAEEMLRAAVKFTGAPGYEFFAPTNAWEEALVGPLHFRPYLAKALLGWAPKKPSVVDGMEVYAKAALAAQRK